MATWQNRIGTNFIIKMGDGKLYAVDYLNAKKSVEYNIAEFVFKNVSGSLVDRGRPRGVVYDLELYIQGDENLDVVKTFQKSADNPGAWTISHPFYDTLYVQPKGLSFDDAYYNVTRITGQVMETILPAGLKLSSSPPEKIQANGRAAIATVNTAYADKVLVMEPTDLQKLKSHIDGTYSRISKLINGYQADADSYFNAYNAANNVLNTALFDTGQIISKAVDLITAPAYFVDTVVNRIRMFEDQLRLYYQDIAAIESIYLAATSNLKSLFENNAGSSIIGMCITTVTNVTNDYIYRPDVLSVINSITDAYNTFIDNLNVLQSVSGGIIDAYAPDPNNIMAIQNLVCDTIDGLLSFYASAKQQRTMTLVYDSNIIIVANKLYRMQPDDSTIQQLIANNNIGHYDMEEFLILKAGRQIIYYV